MQQETNLRNLIIAMVAIAGIMLVWQLVFWGPEQAERDAALAERQAATEAASTETTDPAQLAASSEPAQPVYEDARIPFAGPAVDGSLLLRGSRIDSLNLRGYYETVEDMENENPDAEVQIFQPQSGSDGYYASIGDSKK